MLVTLLYVSSENTALGLTSALIDLGCSPEYWDQLRKATAPLLCDENYRELFKEKTLESCVMESARTNTQIFALQRKPRTTVQLTDKFTITPEVDSVAICQPLLMVYDTADKVFQDATKYDPSRFMPPRNESMRPGDVMTWGNGVHLCPGKQFAVYEIKAALAMIVNHFECFNLNARPNPDYFSPAAFADRRTLVGLQVPMTVVKDREGHPIGWHFKGVLTPLRQREIYRNLVEFTRDSTEQQQLSADATTPLTLAYWNNVHTHAHNMRERPKVLRIMLLQSYTKQMPVFAILSSKSRKIYAVVGYLIII